MAELKKDMQAVTKSRYKHVTSIVFGFPSSNIQIPPVDSDSFPMQFSKRPVSASARSCDSDPSACANSLPRRAGEAGRPAASLGQEANVGTASPSPTLGPSSAASPSGSGLRAHSAISPVRT